MARSKVHERGESELGKVWTSNMPSAQYDTERGIPVADLDTLR